MELLLTDEELAGRVQASDRESFGVLVGRYEAKLIRYGRKFLSEARDIEDLVQDVFIKAYVNLQSFDPRRMFSPWIYRIAHNTFINALHAHRRLPVIPFDFDTFLPRLFAPETTDREAREREVRAMLDQGLDQLDEKYREVLVLFYYEDLDYQAIADILHIPVSTVGVRLNRAKAFLKNHVRR